MKKAWLPSLLILIVLTGCANHYVLKLTNGAEITTVNKPRFKDGGWYFKDAKGDEHFVPAARVNEVAPVSTAARESKPKPVKGPPKKRHWYFLWLA